MEPVIRGPKFIPIGLLHYYHAGVSKDDALAFLLKSHETNPEMFPRVDYRDVDFWYKSFAKKNYDLKQNPAIPELSKLENLPVLDRVLHQVGAEDQKNLMMVSQTFKGFIEKENRLYENIEFRINNQSILLEVRCAITNEKTRTIFRKNGEGCEITQDEMVVQTENPYMWSAFDALRTTVSLRHTKVKTLDISYNPVQTSAEDRKEFIQGAIQVLNELKEKIHLECLKTKFNVFSELDEMVKGINPGSMTTLEFRSNQHQQDSIDLQKLPNLMVHWNHLKSLWAMSASLKMRIGAFVHLQSVTAQLEEVKPDELLAYKEAILALPNFQEHSFHSNRTPANENWKRALEPYDTVKLDFDEDQTMITGSFPITIDSEEEGAKLVFEIRTTPYFRMKFYKKKGSSSFHKFLKRSRV